MFYPPFFEDEADRMVADVMLAEEAGAVSEVKAAKLLSMTVTEYRQKKDDRLLQVEGLIRTYPIYALWSWCKKKFEQGQNVITVSEVQRNCNHRYRNCFAARQDIEKLVQFNLVKWQGDRKGAFHGHLRLSDIPVQNELETA